MFISSLSPNAIFSAFPFPRLLFITPSKGTYFSRNNILCFANIIKLGYPFMQFLFSSYNDYYVHPLFPSRFPSSSNNLIPFFFVILILNNIFFYALRLFFSPFVDVAYSLLYYSLRFELIFLFPFQSLFKHKTINHKHKILHLFIIFLRLCKGVGMMLYPAEREFLVSYVTCREGS